MQTENESNKLRYLFLLRCYRSITDNTVIQKVDYICRHHRKRFLEENFLREAVHAQLCLENSKASFLLPPLSRPLAPAEGRVLQKCLHI